MLYQSLFDGWVGKTIIFQNMSDIRALTGALRCLNQIPLPHGFHMPKICGIQLVLRSSFHLGHCQ